MDISDIVSTDYEQFDADARASKLAGTLGERGAKAVVVTEDDEYLGIVTRRQLASAHRNPDAKARGLVWNVGRVDVDHDLRDVARLMVGSPSAVLPVFEGEEFRGVVTARDLLGKVRPFLGVLTVDDVYTSDLVTVSLDTTLGEVLHRLREERITHLPVVDGDAVVGVVSLADLLDFATREVRRGQGGSPAPEMQAGGGRSHGGFGERVGDIDRLLDLPVADVMTEPVATTTGDEPLDAAVGTMLDAGISSLVVTDSVDDGDGDGGDSDDGGDGNGDGDEPVGIVTTTDVLEALTWADETRAPVQITNVDLLDDISREGVVELVESVTRKYGDMRLLEANVFLHEHDETLRGTPLIMARIRLFTDKGHFVGTGEGYGAGHALRLARNVVERQVLEGKEYARTKKHPPADELTKLYGWWLSGSSRR